MFNEKRKGESSMNGLGYTPICSSSSVSKTCDLLLNGITAPFFRC